MQRCWHFLVLPMVFVGGGAAVLCVTAARCCSWERLYYLVIQTDHAQALRMECMCGCGCGCGGGGRASEVSRFIDSCSVHFAWCMQDVDDDEEEEDEVQNGH